MTLPELIAEPPPHPERPDNFKLGEIRMNFPCVICVCGSTPMPSTVCKTCRHFWL
jgi:hypothetical protein